MSTKFKGDIRVGGNLKLDQEAIDRALTINASGELESSLVTSTELGYLDDVTSPIQTQLNNKAADADVIKKDGSVDFTADQSMGGFKLTNLAAPTLAGDASTKAYVDALAEGLKPKQAVRVATTANIVIATDLNVGDTIDGIVLVDGDRVLVKNQTAAEENGIYVAGVTPARSTDFDSLTPVDEINGAYVVVQQGTVNEGILYVQQGTVAVLDTDPINFVFFNSVAGLIGGDGITVSGNNISVDHDGEGLTFVANQLALELDGATLEKSATGVKLSDTAVTPATLGSASETVTITVDQQGRLTAASEQAISITASQVSDFNEAAQDAVGTILTDSSSVDFTYDDALNTITAAVLPAGVDHDALQNFVANEHIDHSTVNIATAADSGLAGGGDITATRNLSVDINGTTVAAAIDPALDEVLIYDSSAGALRKALIQDIAAANIVETIADTNSIDLTLTGTELTADLKLSATGADASNREVDLIVETDGLRAQIPDANINAVAANLTLSNLSSPVALNQDLVGATSAVNLGTTPIPFNSANAITFYTENQAAQLSASTLASNGINELIIETATNLPGVTQNLILRTGDSDASTTGNIILDPGSTSGTQGHISASSVRIRDVQDPSLAQDAATKNYVDTAINNINGDIELTTFLAANNQAAPVDVSGLVFDPLVVRSFKALVSVSLDATDDLFESFDLLAVQRGADFIMSQVATGDDSGVVFTINSSGQVQYTSANSAGFVQLKMAFRAIVTQV